MADLFFIHSDDPDLVVSSSSGARANLAELSPDGLIDQIDGRGWSLVTVRNPFVPYAVSSDAGGAAVVIGSTYDPAAPHVADLLKAASAGRARVMREYCRSLNYGMALSIKNGEVLAATDWLGLYPVYYFQFGSAFVVTSIPGLLRCVRGFRPGLDIHGLVGLLLLAHTSLGHTLFEGVSRLPSGHLLSYECTGRKRSLEDVPLGNSPSVPTSLGDAVDAFDAALGTMITEATRSLAPVIYLSGGLDSRIIAGYLQRAGGDARTAVTTGDRRDLEVRAAARAASAIGAAHEIIPVDQSRYPQYVQMSLDRDAMTSGLYVLVEWTVSETLRRPMLSGFLGDPVMGTTGIAGGMEPSCDMHSFHAMFMTANAFGLSPGVIRDLIRSGDIDDIIHDVWRRLRDEYDSYPGPPWQRTWWFDLHHRQRFLIGQLHKIIALRSWPILPYAHPSVVRLAAATPLEVLSGRKVQMELLRRRFPELARLPLARGIDRKWYRIEPPRPRVWTRAAEHVTDSLSWHIHKRFDLPERRVFVRTFDFDGPGWMALRDQARAQADKTDPPLNKDIVLKLIPPSSVRTQFRRTVTDATGRKALIGAVLQCSRLMENCE